MAKGGLGRASDDLSASRYGECCSGDLFVDVRNANLGGSGHAGAVGIGEIEARQEELRVRVTHAVDLIVPWAIPVDRSMFIEKIVLARS